MDRYAQAAAVAAAAVVGLAFGGGVAWQMNSNSSEGDDPVRGVRTPCNLVPAETLGEVLPGAVVVSVSGDGEPGEAWSLSKECGLAPKGEDNPSEALLTLRLTRYGDDKEDVDGGKGEKIVVRWGEDRAADEFTAELSRDSDSICRLQPVTGIGRQAAACAGTYYDDVSPAYRVMAQRGDLVVQVLAVARAAANREAVGRLAAGVLEAGR
ncbi:hypothetical protein Acsp04_53730 [Actinomadura sp. NBRC 104425]|uniref:hypothetical protein n=1 Tax=Actinomadura sp. NBRC 104425 TaxID=3032204 RepID=UPI0024A1DF6D|nr:hypothetical protein [Actinomadura sp. NBRC 104425]GLZ15138.1 hypothetical protein Acsp04_53730 [Actinomadura sp. NBRC 104425]